MPKANPTKSAIMTGSCRIVSENQPAQQFSYGWIGPSEAMAHLGIGSLSALYRLIKDWQLPYGRVGARYRFRRCDLDRWTVRRGEALSAAKAS